MRGSSNRKIRLAGGRTLTATPVFDTYWRFAAARQELFMNRVAGRAPPWTTDPVIAAHRFTNAYRAADRVSQYLIRRVIYDGPKAPQEVFFRTMLFKLFNRVDTWELLLHEFGTLTWRDFEVERCAMVLDRAMARGQRLYSAAYIMPSPQFGSPRKHRNHLQLLAQMMRQDLPLKVSAAKSLKQVFQLLLDCPSLGDFLAFQFAIDLNYSEMIDFSEMTFVVAGPGARDGISKCFSDTDGLSESEVIAEVAAMAEDEFVRLGLRFQTLWGRGLQLIDCQNLFCEVSKYSRVVHPDVAGISGRTRIKQKYNVNTAPLPQFYPPKWKLKLPTVTANLALSAPQQQSLQLRAHAVAG
jgi:hypothetical protein